jgi:predicted anti-sigma-YlaC factor YlaD
MVMKCEEIRGLMPDLASGVREVSPDIRGHLAGCSACAGKLEEFRQTMALLDEWRAPEPSAYFDARLQARLREEMAKPQAGWMGWFRRPVLASALTVLMAIGIGLVFRGGEGVYRSADSVVANNDAASQMAEPGTAVGDLSALDKNNDLYSDFELLDDLQVQHNVVANP